jgi:hypothetical protein
MAASSCRLASAAAACAMYTRGAGAPRKRPLAPRRCGATSAQCPAGRAAPSPLPCAPRPHRGTTRCLDAWRHTQRSQGLGRRAGHCELCKAQYVLPGHAGSPYRRGGAGRAAALPRQVLIALRATLADAVRLHAWPALALRLWKGYVMASGMVRLA